VAGLGVVIFAICLTQTPETAAVGALALAAAFLVALAQTSRDILSWPNAIACLVLIIWLIPIKLYRLPVSLPFNLEVYRIAVLLLVVAFLIGIFLGLLPFSTAGHGWALLALAGVAITSQMINWAELSPPGEPAAALKAVSYFISFVVIFLLITAAISKLDDARRLISVLVVGGTVVAAAALYESWTGTNVFDSLDTWVPGLVKQVRELEDLRGGRLRVRSSAQHPIALGVALTMVVPLAVVLSQYALTTARKVLWLVAAGICMLGAFVTVSRTVIAMTIVMVIVGLMLRPERVRKFWPVLLVMPGFMQAIAPGTLGALYRSVFPDEGFGSDLEGREGLGGSGRLSDLGPGLDIWSDAPLVGHGLGYVATATEQIAGAAQGITGFQIIFDNQYMSTLISLGALGVVATIWVVWGAAYKLVSSGREHRTGPEADLVSACAIACAGFATAMLFFDAFAFVQATLVFFIIAAIGLRLRQLGLDPAPVIPLGERRQAFLRRKGLTIWDWTMRR